MVSPQSSLLWMGASLKHSLHFYLMYINNLCIINYTHQLSFNFQVEILRIYQLTPFITILNKLSRPNCQQKWSLYYLIYYKIKIMSEVNATEQVVKEGHNETYLQTVIDCITERNTSRIHIQEDSNLNNLYGKADNMISELDKGINLCKKYNQAKINRKYEIIINDLQTEIKRLQDNLKLQQDARSPTKKHVSDILQKLVSFKNQNENLQKQNHELKNKIKFLQDQISNQSHAINKMQIQHAKSTIERLPPINPSPSLVETVKEYLKGKQQVRKLTKNPISPFQKFLNQIKPKLWNWNIESLLQQIDKWSEGTKEKTHQDVDMWRIRSSIARKFSDYMDQPQSLLKPSVKSQQTLWQKLQNKNNQNKGKFSYLGSKRSLNASFH